MSVRPPTRPFVAFAALALPSFTAPAQEAQAEPAAAVIRSDATTMILPAGAHELKDLIDATARFLHRNILSDPQELASSRGKVELQRLLQLDAAGCEEAVCELLFSAGFVLVPRDEPKGIYEVVLLAGPRSLNAFASAPMRTPEQILARPSLKQPVITLVPLLTINATVATNALRPFFARGAKAGPGVTFGTTGDNQSLLVQGLQSDVASAIRLLRQADGQTEATEPPPPPPDLQQQVAELTKAVQELQRRIAELEQRLGGGR